MNNIKPDYSTQREKAIQLRLQEELDGKIEVNTPAGRIDLLTNADIIEIKEVSKWKHAIGQVLTYGLYHPSKTKKIYLFGETDQHDIITYAASQYNITVVFIE